MPTAVVVPAAGGSTGVADEMSIVCAGVGWTSLLRDSLRTIGRVDGFTCHSKRSSAPTVMLVSSASSKRIGSPTEPSSWMTGEVDVLNAFWARTIAPAGAVPSRIPCRAVLAVLSSAL